MTAPAGERPSFFDQIGPRALRRAEPRASIAVAGAGCALAVLGVLIVSGDTGARDGDFNRWPGVVLSAAVIAAGFVVLSQIRRGPVATGGAVAAGLGVPPLLFFLTFDPEGFPPYSTEAILGVSTLAWLGTYLVGPGRGRPFFLGAGLIGLWATVLQLTEKVFDLPFTFMNAFAYQFQTSFDDPYAGDAYSDYGPYGPSVDTPDPTVLGMIGLVLGVAYLVIGRGLDRSARHGAATPFALAALPLLATAPMFLADELETAGSGLLVMAIGAGLAIIGAGPGRRATTWIGGGAVALGAAIFLTDMTDDATVGGMLFLAAGTALVFLAHLYATSRNEPDELEITGAPMAGVGAAVAPVPLPAEPAEPVAGTAGYPAPPAPPAEDPAPDQAEDGQWAPPSDDDTPPPPPPPPF